MIKPRDTVMAASSCPPRVEWSHEAPVSGPMGSMTAVPLGETGRLVYLVTGGGP